MGPFVTPEQPTVLTLKEDPDRPGNSVWLYSTDALKADGKEVSLSPKPFRPLRFVGTTPGNVQIVAYEPSGSDANGISTAMYVSPSGVASYAVVPSGDCTAAIAADRAKARVVWT